MRILWFEVTPPSKYTSSIKNVIGGWQDALENIVKRSDDIDLIIAFESDAYTETKIIDGVTYVPMNMNYTTADKIYNRFSLDRYSSKVISLGRTIIKKYKPDLIHVFGTEWPFGLLASFTEIPCVIHVQGSIVSYNNSYFPPSYNYYTIIKALGITPRTLLYVMQNSKKVKSREMMERKIWGAVKFYMGRTVWDKAIVNTLTKTSEYFHVDEALRPAFLETSKHWNLNTAEKLRLVTVGCSTFWKGTDVMLKVAEILKNKGVNFEWNVAGYIPDDLRKIIEYKEKKKFADYNIRFLGFVQPEDLIDLLCNSSLYVHTAYIENSPNSICEAQFLGVPIISTMVGGIETLIRNQIDGILVPANDPWRLASEIIMLTRNVQMLLNFSKNSRTNALERHSPQKILNQLLNCYHKILSL